MQETRVCTACGEELPLSAYYKNGKDKDGRVAYRMDCKRCYNIGRKIDKSKHNKFRNNTRHRVGDMQEPVLTVTEWRQVLVNFKGQCAYCGHDPTRRGERLTKEHVVPVVKGGKTTVDNIVPACQRCNSSKSWRDLDEWYPKQPFYCSERHSKIKTIIGG